MNAAQVIANRAALARTIMITGTLPTLSSNPFKKRKAAMKAVLSQHDVMLDTFWPSAIKRCLNLEGVITTETERVRQVIQAARTKARARLEREH